MSRLSTNRLRALREALIHRLATGGGKPEAKPHYKGALEWANAQLTKREEAKKTKPVITLNIGPASEDET